MASQNISKEQMNELIDLSNDIVKGCIDNVNITLQDDVKITLQDDVKTSLHAAGIGFINDLIEDNAEITSKQITEVLEDQLPKRVNAVLEEQVYIAKRQAILPKAFKDLNYENIHSSEGSELFMNKQGRVLKVNTNSHNVLSIHTGSGTTIKKMIKNFALGLSMDTDIKVSNSITNNLINVISRLGHNFLTGATIGGQIDKTTNYKMPTFEKAIGYKISQSASEEGETSILSIVEIDSLTGKNKTAIINNFILLHEEATAIWNAYKRFAEVE